MTDDIRAALRAYAATTPDLDPRAGLGDRLARRDRRQRAAVAGVACLAAVVAGTGVAALTRGPGDTARIVVADDPTPSESSTATASPSVTPSPTATATPTTGPTPRGTTPPPTSRPPAEPTPAAPIVRAAGGPDGLRVRVTLDPGSMPTATTAGLAVHAEDDDGDPYVAGVVWGDGSYEMVRGPMYACPSPPPPSSPRPPDPGEVDGSYRHAWRHDGTYTLRVTVVSAKPCVPDPPEREERTVEIEVVVSDGRVTSNGPARPDVTFDSYGAAPRTEAMEPYVITAEGTYHDADGFIGGVTIDWGDGTRPTFHDTDGRCDDGGGKYYPHRERFTFNATHKYPSPGKYTVTMTATSTGCGGGDVQRAKPEVAEVDIESVD